MEKFIREKTDINLSINSSVTTFEIQPHSMAWFIGRKDVCCKFRHFLCSLRNHCWDIADWFKINEGVRHTKQSAVKQCMKSQGWIFFFFNYLHSLTLCSAEMTLSVRSSLHTKHELNLDIKPYSRRADPGSIYLPLSEWHTLTGNPWYWEHASKQFKEIQISK